MNSNQLRSFVTVCQTLNFTNAAKQLGVPQSTISRQINDLEEKLEAKLFHRTKRDVQLTAEGRAFLPFAKDILDSAQKGASAVKQLHEGAKGRLSIATIETANTFLADCIKTFASRYPGIVVDIDCISCGDALQEEGEGIYDFHFMYYDMIPDNEEYGTVFTHMDPLTLVVPAGHHLTKGPLTAEQLQYLKFILVSEDENPILNMQIMNYCRSKRFYPDIANRHNDMKAVLLSVASGLGVSILPESMTKLAPAGAVEAIPLDDETCAIVCAAAWKKSLLNPAAGLFLQVVQELAPKK